MSTRFEKRLVNSQSQLAEAGTEHPSTVSACDPRFEIVPQPRFKWKYSTFKENKVLTYRIQTHRASGPAIP